MARLLVFTPTFGDGPMPETIESVAMQRFNGELVHEVSYYNPFPGERNLRNVTAQYQRARQMMMDGGFGALVCVEHDMALLPNCIARMLELSAAHDAPVVYSPYMLRHGTNVLSTWQKNGQKNLGMSLSLYPKELALYRRRGWGEISGVGFGCTLIRAETLRAVGIRQPADNHAPDIPFATDCLRGGIRQIGAFDVPSRHYHAGQWLEAYDMSGEKSRVLALANVTVNADGATLPLKKGSYYTLPRAVAAEQARAGYVKLTLTEGEYETAAVEPIAEKGVMTTGRKKGKNAVS